MNSFWGRRVADILVLALGSGTAVGAVPLWPTATVHLAVPAYVNDKGPFPFILDTGADVSAVYLWFAKQQGFKAGRWQSVDGMTGARRMPSFILERLSVDRRVIVNVQADGLPNRHNTEIQAGVAGNDLLDGTVAIFDFPCKKVEIHTKPVNMDQLLSSAATRIEAGTVTDGTQLTVPVRLGSAAGLALLDTGSSDSRISLELARAARIDPSSDAFHDAEPIFGAASIPVPSRHGPIGTIAFGGFEIRDAESRVMDLPVFKTLGLGSQPVMILGLDLLQSLRVIYDHQAKLIWFDTSACGPAGASRVR